MDKKTKLIIGLIGSLGVCLFGVYRLVLETPSTVNSLIIPIAFAVAGFIGFIGNLVKLKKVNNEPY
jgi:ABC-type antimicrobial peptide transport system permease subunit